MMNRAFLLLTCGLIASELGCTACSPPPRPRPRPRPSPVRPDVEPVDPRPDLPPCPKP